MSSYPNQNQQPTFVAFPSSSDDGNDNGQAAFFAAPAVMPIMPDFPPVNHNNMMPPMASQDGFATVFVPSDMLDKMGSAPSIEMRTFNSSPTGEPVYAPMASAKQIDEEAPNADAEMQQMYEEEEIKEKQIKKMQVITTLFISLMIITKVLYMSLYNPLVFGLLQFMHILYLVGIWKRNRGVLALLSAYGQFVTLPCLFMFAYYLVDFIANNYNDYIVQEVIVLFVIGAFAFVSGIATIAATKLVFLLGPGHHDCCSAVSFGLRVAVSIFYIVLFFNLD